MTDTPKLYCGTYHKYNSGSIAGAWLDLTQYETVEDFFKACAKLHKDEEDPEFMFQDFECFPKSLYSESMSKADLQPLLDFAHLDEEDRELVDEFMDATGEDFGQYSLEQIRDSIEMKLDNTSMLSPAEQLGYNDDDAGLIDIPENLYFYFDFKKYGEERLADCVESENYIFNLNRI